MCLGLRRHVETTGQGEDRDLGISLVVGQPGARLEVEEDKGDRRPVIDRHLSMSTADGFVLFAQPSRDRTQVEDVL
jgi:hypothetical protein